MNVFFEFVYVDFLVDLGYFMLNCVVDGFVKVGGVGVLYVVF